MLTKINIQIVNNWVLARVVIDCSLKLTLEEYLSSATKKVKQK